MQREQLCRLRRFGESIVGCAEAQSAEEIKPRRAHPKQWEWVAADCKRRRELREMRQPKPSDEHWKLAANYMNIAAGGSLVGAASTIPVTLFTRQLDFVTALQFSGALVLGSSIVHGIGQIFLRQATS